VLSASERLRLEASRERDRAVGLGVSADEYAALQDYLNRFGHAAVAAYLAWRRGAWCDELSDMLELEELKRFEEEKTNPCLTRIEE
jgi:hypothetical protein